MNKRTLPNPDKVQYYPARIQGYERGWFSPTVKPKYAGTNHYWYRTTYLGITPSEQSTVNGVIYSMSEKEFVATDKREKIAGYELKSIDWKAVEFLSPIVLDIKKGNLNVWVTPPSENLPKPCLEAPLVQSYIDLALGGCIDIDQQIAELTGQKEQSYPFSTEFLKTTSGWNEFWENDRQFPRRPRAGVPHFETIDSLLYQSPYGKLYAAMKPSCFYLTEAALQIKTN